MGRRPVSERTAPPIPEFPSPVDPHVLATALRDLSYAAGSYELRPSEKTLARLRQAQEYAKRVLDEFAAVEVDVFPRYLIGAVPYRALGR